MKLRLLIKTPYQKKLDRMLFEAVGNGERRLQQLSCPNLDTVKQLIRNGATVDHFLFFDLVANIGFGDDDDLETSTALFSNAIG